MNEKVFKVVEQMENWNSKGIKLMETGNESRQTIDKVYQILMINDVWISNMKILLLQTLSNEQTPHSS